MSVGQRVRVRWFFVSVDWILVRCVTQHHHECVTKNRECVTQHHECVTKNHEFVTKNHHTLHKTDCVCDTEDREGVTKNFLIMSVGQRITSLDTKLIVYVWQWVMAHWLSMCHNACVTITRRTLLYWLYWESQWEWGLSHWEWVVSHWEWVMSHWEWVMSHWEWIMSQWEWVMSHWEWVMSHLTANVPIGVSNVDLSHLISVSKETYKRIVCIWKEMTNLLCTTYHAD